MTFSTDEIFPRGELPNLLARSLIRAADFSRVSLLLLAAGEDFAHSYRDSRARRSFSGAGGDPAERSRRWRVKLRRRRPWRSRSISDEMELQTSRILTLSSR
eukprot:TRINITY_DN1157_c0_g1_i1.p2 TRINITY_DN1157_c0_g1~~TRINITY_DN1157_c0_g1_i1.p2  ORF type:complete len:102 (-),score=8.25 TRINITY_DN1157_c0_g1_i1:429-734(-)